MAYYPVLKSFTAEGVNDALRKIVDGTTSLIASGGVGIGGPSTTDIANQLSQLDSKYVPLIRRVNNLMLMRDITIEAKDVPYDTATSVQTVKERIDLLGSLLSIDGSYDTYSDMIVDKPQGDYPGQGFVVKVDETHNGEQWLYIWGADSLGVYSWKAITTFGVNLDNYYTKTQTMSTSEIIDDQNRQSQLLIENTNNTVSRFDTANRNWTNTQISTSATNTLNLANAYAVNQDARLRTDVLLAMSNLVPKTTKVNGKLLATDITVNSGDVPYKDGKTVYQALTELESVIVIVGAVENESDLPSAVLLDNNIGYVVRNGIHYPPDPVHGPYPELFIVRDHQWIYLCRLLIDVSLYFTREEAVLWKQEVIDATLAVIEDLNQRLISEISRATGEETNLGSRIDNENIRATARENELSTAIINMGSSTLTQATNYVDSQVEIFFTNLAGKVDTTFTPSLLFGIAPFTTAPANLTLNFIRTFLDGHLDLPGQVPFPMASASQAGAFSAEDYATFATLNNRLTNVENQGSYIGQSFATYNDFSIWMNQGTPDWVTVNNYTYIVSDESRTAHQGKYPTTKWIYSDVNGQLVWEFGLIIEQAPTSNFSLQYAGLILGSQLAGEIYPNANGTGAVNGWDALVTSNQNDINRLNTIDTAWNNLGYTGIIAVVTDLLTRMAAAETTNNQQNTRLTNLENRMNAAELAITSLTNRVYALEQQGGNFVRKTGDTMTGYLYVPANTIP